LITPRVMQRTQVLKSSQGAAATRAAVAASRAATRAFPSCVSAGTLPSGGSTMSDVRVNATPGSRQKELYVPGSPARGG
jgi:hypothetical protein